MFDLLLLILQIIVILGAARLVGWLFRKIRQPQVVGEMAAGILLGPSLLGLVAPRVYGFIFPADSLSYLNAISQIGLIIFMFLIGLELDVNILRGRGHTTVITSQISIYVPFLLGILLAVFLYPRLSYEDVPFFLFAMFIGTAMSITAFPVLARILSERKMLRTHLGTVAIACAAVDDITGWMILAVLMLLARASESILPLWGMIVGVGVYLGIMLFPLRRLMCWIEDYYQQRGQITQGILALILLFALASAWSTEFLGIHALIGAFLAGVIMPRHHGFVHALTEKLNDFTVVFLLPLFFAYTGLRTSVALLDSPVLWLYCGLIILVAVLGKFSGGSIPARLTGMTWRDSWALGALMNTRGLMELVLLNIALDIGLITPTLFTMLVFMALTTTFMTAPVLEWLYFRRMVPPVEYTTPAPEVLPPEEEEYVPVD
ncbi:MAG: hypothetical protein A2W35_12700 [Chloroflexi bacterium RBG_16_57_11]|nr:MAG: hypothetical protein A2W35_12700 [Chloroflexi bacterium RBG_16_57_11]